jgi:hypothetical protein
MPIKSVNPERNPVAKAATARAPTVLSLSDEAYATDILTAA